MWCPVAAGEGIEGCMAGRKPLGHRATRQGRAISSAGERPPDTGEVSGSIPLSPTTPTIVSPRAFAPGRTGNGAVSERFADNSIIEIYAAPI
jgi:hypothetical protein